MQDLFRLVRIGNCLIAFIAVLIGFWLERGVLWEYGLIGGIVAFGICCAGNIANNISDYKKDSKQKNPISSGKISLDKAWNLFFIFSFVSLGLSLVLNSFAVYIAIGIYLLMVVYAFLMKKFKWLGNFAVALGTGLTFLFGGVIVGSFGIVSYVFVSAVLVNIGREIAKDLEDYKRDKGEKLGFPYLIGRKYSGILSGVFVLSGFPFSLYLYNFFGLEYLVVCVLSLGVFCFGVGKVFAGKYLEGQELFKKGMIVFMIALIIGGLL